ncbi:MAG TPA: metallophosphoesterase [Labilithrix sp.]|nr:metallophosphoesterase [Labilithrix sp.]
MRRASFPLGFLVLSGLAGCGGCGGSKEPAPAVPSAPASAAVTSAPSPASRPAPERLVAIGDLHGDLEAMRRVFRLAGAIDAKDAWIGGKLMVVQTGDAVDRGDDDRAILDLLERLKAEAAKAGGELLAMSGNHEIMNATFDFRYVTPGAFATFADVVPKESDARKHAEVEPAARGRAAAFTPGSGAYAAMIADRPVIVRVGDTLFAHGGILPKHVTFGIDRINDETRGWLLGKQSIPPRILTQEDGPIWTRMYSAAPGREECVILDEVLKATGAKRMVMGHTVQRNGINPACDSKAWRIDVGMAKVYEGPIQALEIKGEAVKVLKAE